MVVLGYIFAQSALLYALPFVIINIIQLLYRGGSSPKNTINQINQRLNMTSNLLIAKLLISPKKTKPTKLLEIHQYVYIGKWIH